MIDIRTIHAADLERDRADSIADILFCEKLNAERYRNRAAINRQIVERIDAEMERRSNLPCSCGAIGKEWCESWCPDGGAPGAML